MKKRLIALFSLSFLIRLISLNQSLWLDEAVTAKVVRTFSLFQIPVLFSPGDFHPPLYYLFMKLWTVLFGYSEIALRLPSVICSILTGYVVYRIGYILKGKSLGFWAAALFLFNPLIVYYSQEARMYSMVTLFLTCALWALVLLIKKGKHPSPKVMISFVAFSALALWTFYGSAFFIIAMVVALFVSSRKKESYLALGGFILAILVVSPLLMQQITTAQVSLSAVSNWRSVLGTASIKNLVLVLLKFAGGRISFTPKPLYFAVAGLWTLIIGVIAWWGAVKNRLLGILFVLPLLIGLVFSFVSPMLQYFRFLYLLPVLALLVGSGLDILYGRDERGRMIVTGIFIGFAFVYLLMPRFHREDWKTLVRIVPQDTVIYMILPSSDPVTYYRPQAHLKEIRNIETLRRMEPDIFVVPYVTEIYGFDYKQALSRKGCIHIDETSLRELTLEKWKCGFMAKK